MVISRQMLFIGLISLACLSPGLMGCDETPTGRKQLVLMPDSKLAAYGAKTFEDLKRTQPVVTDPALNRYVDLYC